MRVAAIQIAVTPGDLESNTAKMLTHLVTAARGGADVVVFPEMCDTGYDMPVILKSAQSWNNGTVPALRKAANDLNVNVIAGVSELTEEGVFNSTAIISRHGDIAGRYRKTHLITAAPMLEHQFLKSGDKLGMAQIEEIHCGLMTCYDIRFPEIARSLSIAGAEILFIPSAFPMVRLPHWTILTAARAIENQVFVVACNRIGTDAGMTFCGTTTIIDPYGTVVASASAIHEGPIFGDINLNMIQTVRSQIKVHQDRRPALYALST